ncbi:MAG: metallopeptidase family protein [Mycobacteriales bacterium]
MTARSPRPRAAEYTYYRRAGAWRDRRGRGLRGRLLPATVPLARSRTQIFDDLVLDTVEHLEHHFPEQLGRIEFAVEDVPPELPAYDSDVLQDGSVPLARLIAGRTHPQRGPIYPRIVVYQWPLEARAGDRDELAELVHEVLTEQVANALGIDPDLI